MTRFRRFVRRLIYLVVRVGGRRRRGGRFRLTILQMMILTASVALVLAIRVHTDREIRASSVARAQAHLAASADHYRSEARLLAEASTRTGNEAYVLKIYARSARIRAVMEEDMAAATLKGTGIDPASLLVPK